MLLLSLADMPPRVSGNIYDEPARHYYVYARRPVMRCQAMRYAMRLNTSDAATAA